MAAFAFAFVVAEGVGDAVGVTRSARARLAASASITRPRCSGPASVVGDPYTATTGVITSAAAPPATTHFVLVRMGPRQLRPHEAPGRPG